MLCLAGLSVCLPGFFDVFQAIFQNGEVFQISISVPGLLPIRYCLAEHLVADISDIRSHQRKVHENISVLIKGLHKQQIVFM